MHIPDQCTKQAEPSTSTQEDADAKEEDEDAKEEDEDAKEEDEDAKEEEEEEEAPSASQAHANNMNDKVCYIMLEEAMANIIANEWRQSSRSIQDITGHVCEAMVATILSPQWHERMMSQARIIIRR